MSKHGATVAKKTSVPKPQVQSLVPISLELTPEQRDKLQLLGGATWVRDAIDKAKVPVK